MIPCKHRGVYWSDEDIQSLITLYQNGNSVASIVKIIGRTRDAIQHKIIEDYIEKYPEKCKNIIEVA